MKQVKLSTPDFWRAILSAAALAAVAVAATGGSAAAQEGTAGAEAAETTGKTKSKLNIVLVHGAWADGSSWSEVIPRLQREGYNVVAPQFPLTTTGADVARLRQVLATQDGPTLVVGHSYGGQIMTSLGADAPNVVGLVYIAAFGLDQGESIGGLLSGPPTPALAHLRVDPQGFAYIPQDDFVKYFASDVNRTQANVMYAVQQPASVSILAETMGVPAWKSLPSWYMVATNDEAIPPDAQRLFAQRMGATVVEVKSSHVPLVSRPNEVVRLIKDAARVVGAGN